MPKKSVKSEFIELSLAQLRPNPYNPRRRFDGPDFDRFVANVAANGILQPPLVRPVAPEDGITHEIVFGGRRFAAACALADANGGRHNQLITVRVREIDDETALDMMTVENLQREDLSPLEEARGFQIYVAQRGEAAIEDLSGRIKISEQYIRRRLNILTLPSSILDVWDAGKIKFSHVEQLARVKDKQWRAALFKHVVDYSQSPAHLRREIESEAPELAQARFDTSECAGCMQNTDMQKKLWDFDSPEIKCLNRACFQRKQQAHLDATWKESPHRKQFSTHRPVVRLGWENPPYEAIYADKVPKPCAKCEDFVTVFDLDGDLCQKRACIGDAACFKTLSRRKDENKPEKKQPGAEAPADPASEDSAPRVAWHGSEFADRFYKEQIPLRLTEEFPDAAAEVLFYNSSLLDRLAIVLLLCLSRDKAVQEVVAAKIGVPGESFHYRVPLGSVIDFLKQQDHINLRELLAGLLAELCLRETWPGQRKAIAKLIGIDLATEFAMTEEYLQKKTKDELLDLGHGLGIFEDEKAKAFLFEKLLKKRGGFGTCKKPELIRVILESGVDLKGKVPAEILAVTNRDDSEGDTCHV